MKEKIILHAVHCLISMLPITNLYDKYRGVPRIWEGGGARIFFSDLGICEAMRIARGVRGHAPPRKFFKTVQFGAF